MSQITWRAPDHLIDRVKEVAASEGRSVNEYLTRLARAAVDPEAASDDHQRIRERLARAGILAPAGAPRPRPDDAAVAAARREAAGGATLSDLVVDGRR